MTDIKVYNVISYDGVDAYCSKAIGQNEEDVKETFKKYDDLEVLKIDYLYDWNDLDEHIAGALKGKWKLVENDEQLNIAVRRYIDLKCGFELACI